MKSNNEYFSLLNEIYSQNYNTIMNEMYNNNMDKNFDKKLAFLLLSRLQNEKTLEECRSLVKEWMGKNPQLLVD